MIEVTFETKCWEKDYALMLKTNHLHNMIENCNYQFAHRHLIINNVNNEKYVLNLADKYLENGLLTNVFTVSSDGDECLKRFEIKKDSFGENGYKYSIAELVGIYRCKTKYLLHFSSDSYIPKKFNFSNWINESIDLMEKNSNIIVCNPVWNNKWDEAKKESIYCEKNFYISQGFSDQCYLINTEIFKKPIYNFYHLDSERYPKYGGNLFEKRVDSYMRVDNKLRGINKNVTYISKNIKPYQFILEKLCIKNI